VQVGCGSGEQIKEAGGVEVETWVLVGVVWASVMHATLMSG